MELLSLFPNSDNQTHVSAGTSVFEEGQPGDRMYVIIEGEVGFRSSDGTTFGQLSAGELFGEMALIDDEPRSLTAVANSDTVLAEVDERQFLFLVHETPSFALHVMGVMAERLRDSQSS